MAIGQGVLGEVVLDVAAVDRLTARIEARETDRSVQHAEQLLDALALSRVWANAGMGLGTEAQLALVLACSELRAGSMLHEAKVLERLAALGPMRDGLLTVEQARVVVELLGPVGDALGASLWERIAGRLEADRAEGIVRPPARLRELLTRWLIAADPDAWAARRKDAAKDDADVELWSREGGLVDLVGRGLSAADAIACNDRIASLAQPLGPADDRTSGQRRQGALVDLLLGRVGLPFDQAAGEATGQRPAACCPPGSSTPCGAHIFIHVPIGTAAGKSTEPAELVGHGPIDRGELTDLLAAGAVLHRVWVDSSGVPIAVDDHVWTPGRDPDALREVLVEMRTGPPPEVRHPSHPDDHPPGSEDHPPGGAAPRPHALTRPHLTDPGGYVPPRRLQQLLRGRVPRCEWPACARRASRSNAAGCDLDHDLAWPFGPTCACNIGSLCRRHHRIKQLGWIKHRRADGSVRWTSPTGRTWTSPNQHRHLAPHLPPQHRRGQLIAPGVWAIAAG